MNTLNVKIFDEPTGLFLTQTVNAWRFYAWNFAASVAEDQKVSERFMQFMNFLLEADKEAVGLENPAETLQDLVPFIKAMELVRDTNGFDTFRDLSIIPEALLKIEEKLKIIYEKIKAARNPEPFLQELNMLIDEQYKFHHQDKGEK